MQELVLTLYHMWSFRLAWSGSNSKISLHLSERNFSFVAWFAFFTLGRPAAMIWGILDKAMASVRLNSLLSDNAPYEDFSVMLYLAGRSISEDILSGLIVKKGKLDEERRIASELWFYVMGLFCRRVIKTVMRNPGKFVRILELSLQKGPSNPMQHLQNRMGLFHNTNIGIQCPRWLICALKGSVKWGNRLVQRLKEVSRILRQKHEQTDLRRKMADFKTQDGSIRDEYSPFRLVHLGTNPFQPTVAYFGLFHNISLLDCWAMRWVGMSQRGLYKR